MRNIILLFQKVQCLVLSKVLVCLTNIHLVLLGKLTNENHQVFYSVTNIHITYNKQVYNMLTHIYHME